MRAPSKPSSTNSSPSSALLSYGVLFFAFGFVTLVAVAIVLAVFQVSASFKF